MIQISGLAVLLVQHLRHTDSLSIQIFNHQKAEWPFGNRGRVSSCVCSLLFFFFWCNNSLAVSGLLSVKQMDNSVAADLLVQLLILRMEVISHDDRSEKRTSVCPCSEQRNCGFSLLLQGREPWTGSFPSRTWSSSLLPASLESLFWDFSIFLKKKKTEGSSGCVWNMVCLFSFDLTNSCCFSS